MIISASRRTDIPAFYSTWFINRLRAGFVLVPNPFNPGQVRRVSLAPRDVDAIVFWTRNAAPLLPHLAELDARGYRYYFHYTITGYPAPLEKSTPGLEQALQCFCQLSDAVGPDRVLWRYDPILLCNLVGFMDHQRSFAEIASALQGITTRVTISFADFYKKTQKNLRGVAGLSFSDITQDLDRSRKLVQSLARIAGHCGMDLRTCATDIDLMDHGVTSGKCIDEKRLKTVFGIDYPHQKDKGQRPACGCVKSIDIGQYNTCLHGCAYCYATYDHARAASNKTRHDPHSPVLLGQPPKNDSVATPRQYTLF